jgi:spore coat polysaccharide biosynthesis protein SpsF
MMDILVIQCRHDSKRLPGKALYPFYGTTILGFLLKRLKRLTKKYPVILATSQEPSDDIVADWGESHTTPVVRGSEHNVLERFQEVLSSYPARTVTRITADNPFTCPELIEETISHVHKGRDYVYFEDVPAGATADTFSRTCFDRIVSMAHSDAEKEHINKVVLDNPKLFNILRSRTYSSNSLPTRESLTIDTKSEWRILSSLELPRLWDSSLTEVLSALKCSSLK